MEAAQRNVEEIVRRDMEQMEEVVEDMNKINAALNETHSIMQDFAILAKRSKASNIITSDIIKVESNF